VRPSPKLLLGIAVSAFGAYAVLCGYLWARQRTLIFIPDATVARTPADLGLAYSEVRIPLGDGAFVYGWWLPANDASSGATLLYLHGNDGNLGFEVARLQALATSGHPILAIDYRGYGASSGPAPSERQVYDDATAAWDHLVRDRGIDPRTLVLYGHSLGGAVAVELALRRAPLCAVVLDGTFTSLAALARSRFPLVPVAWLLDQRFDTAGKMSRLRVPALLVHGTADEEVPVAMARQLHALAPVDKELLLVPGAGHEEALLAGRASVVAAISRAVDRCRAKAG
jgi:pimeloyl-ACP methyl ester carboxylesterase